jgi:L-ribulokinase
MSQESKYALGIDFGTETGRAVLVETKTGKEIAASVYPYQNGVIDETLPVEGEAVKLEPEWALQDPDDYIRTLQKTVPDVLAQAAVNPEDVIGIGIDFTACTMLPVKSDGTPLCLLPVYRRNPHAWIKLWKHHAAQPEADRINTTARDMGEKWLERYGGKYHPSGFLPKRCKFWMKPPKFMLPPIACLRLPTGLSGS